MPTIKLPFPLERLNNDTPVAHATDIDDAVLHKPQSQLNQEFAAASANVVRQAFVTQAEYDALVEDHEIEEDVLYNIYEEEEDAPT